MSEHKRLSFVERNPLAIRAAAVGVATAFVHVLVVVGVVSPDLEVAIAGAVDALGLLLVVVLGMRAVTPNAKVIARVNTSGGITTGEAAAAEAALGMGTDLVVPVREELLSR